MVIACHCRLLKKILGWLENGKRSWSSPSKLRVLAQRTEDRRVVDTYLYAETESRITSYRDKGALFKGDMNVIARYQTSANLVGRQI